VNQAKYPIFLLSFPNEYLMAATFMRFQEHYESPEFRGRVFDLETFMDWYAGEHDGFTYFEDWGGFNLPDAALRPFFEGRFDPLTRKETALLDLFRRVPPPYYVIAGENDENVAHEIVHGLFYVVPEYGRAVRECLKRYELSKAWRALEEIGYSSAVFDDEVNAYCLTGLYDGLKAAKRTLKAARRELAKIFESFFGFEPRPKNWPKLLAMVHQVKFKY